MACFSARRATAAASRASWPPRSRTAPPSERGAPPSAGLSPALQRLIFDRILDINAGGVGIVLVEQNARESLRLCRRGYVLVMGQTRAEGPGDELLADPEIRRAYLGDE